MNLFRHSSKAKLASFPLRIPHFLSFLRIGCKKQLKQPLVNAGIKCDIPYLLKISSLIFKMVPANILISPNGTSWLYQGIAGQSPLPNMPYLPFRGFSNQLSGYHGLLVLPYPLYWSYPFLSRLLTCPGKPLFYSTYSVQI